MRRLAILAIALLAGGVSVAAEKPRVSGRCVLRGKTLDFRYVSLVRGVDSEGRALACVLLSPDDVSAPLEACANLNCAVFEVVRAGIVLEPEANGDFWLRAVHPDLPGERQASYRGWKASIDEPGRLAGSLSYTLEKDLVVEVTFDAPLSRDFSARKEPK